MASGCVVEYHGKRGTVYRLKFVDASGRQVMETVGPAKTRGRPEGFTRREAEAKLRDRLSDVDRKRWRRPQPIKFREASRRWKDETDVRKRWRASTVAQYATITARLDAFFGPMQLGAIRSSDVSRYVTVQLGRYAAASVSRDLSILHSIFKWAVVEELLERNPAEGMPHPKAVQRKGHALKPEQVQLLARSFANEQARVAFLTFVLTGVRRAELQALRWRDVDLIENVLRIVDSKTETGVRAIALTPGLHEELWQHRRRSAFQGNDERVFCHPKRGRVYRYDTYKAELKRAFAAAGLEWPEGMRPATTSGSRRSRTTRSRARTRSRS